MDILFKKLNFYLESQHDIKMDFNEKLKIILRLYHIFKLKNMYVNHTTMLLSLPNTKYYKLFRHCCSVDILSDLGNQIIRLK